MIQIKIENKIEVFNIPEEIITCKICGGTYRKITNSHLKKHGLSQKLYLKKYPTAILTCASTLRKQSKIKKEWIKNHPEWKPPPSQLKKFRQNKEVVKKDIAHITLVHNLPYMKKRFSINAIKNKNNIISAGKESSRKHREYKNRFLPIVFNLRKNGFTLREIANIVGVSSSTIDNWVKLG